jgi:hypothetical protein
VYTEPGDTRPLWQKFAGLAPSALLTTSANAPLGPARERYHNWLTALANEAAEAGGRAGVRIDAGLLASWLTRAPDDLRSSMLEDQLAGEAARTRHNRRADPVGGADHGGRGPGVLTLRDARSSLALGGNALLGKVGRRRPVRLRVALQGCAVPP